MRTRCRDAERWMLLRASGELSPARTEALARHLRACHACGRTLADWTALSHRFAGARGQDDPPRTETIARIVAAAEEAAAARQRVAARQRHWTLLAAAAALALLLGAFVTGRFASPPAPDGAAAAAMTDDAAWWLTTGMGETGLRTLAGGTAGQEAETLAELLLQFQGMDMESQEEWLETVTSVEERRPTALRWHSTGGSRPGICG